MIILRMAIFVSFEGFLFLLFFRGGGGMINRCLLIQFMFWIDSGEKTLFSPQLCLNHSWLMVSPLPSAAALPKMVIVRLGNFYCNALENENPPDSSSMFYIG